MPFSDSLQEYFVERLRDPEVAGGYLTEILSPSEEPDDLATRRKLLADFFNILIREHDLKGEVTDV